MAGRYQGYQRIRNEDGEEYFEIVWKQNGWFWHLRSPGSAPEGETIGPFTTSTEAYQDARGQKEGRLLGDGKANFGLESSISVRERSGSSGS